MAVLQLWDQLQDLLEEHKARFVPYAVLEDAAADTLVAVQQRGHPHASLLRHSNGSYLELYRSTYIDEDGVPARIVVAVDQPQLGGMVAAKLAKLDTYSALGAFLMELCSLKRLGGKWGFSFDRRRRRGAVITKLFDGGDLAAYIDKSVLRAHRGHTRTPPHRLLWPLAKVARQMFEFNLLEEHAWIDGKASNVALSKDGSAGMIDVGSALPHGPVRREAICATYNNHDAQTYCDRKVTMQTDVTSLGVMVSDVLVGRPANIGGLVAGSVGYKPTTMAFQMIRLFINEQPLEAALALELPVANLLAFEPMLARVGLLFVALLICPENAVKLTLQEAACGLDALACAQEHWDSRKDGRNGTPFVANHYLFLARMCAFIGKRRKGLPDSPSVSRGGAAVLGEGGLDLVRDLYLFFYDKFEESVATFAPYWTSQGAVTEQAWEAFSDSMPPAMGELPPLCRPALEPEQFEALFAFEEGDSRHFLTQQVIDSWFSDFHSSLFYGPTYYAGRLGSALTMVPLQDWLHSLLPPTLECAEQHAGHLVPTSSNLTCTLAASLARAGRSAGSPPCAQLQQLTLAEADGGSDAGSGSEEEEEEEDQLLTGQVTVAEALPAGGGEAAQDSQAGAAEGQHPTASVEEQVEPMEAAEERHTAETAGAAGEVARQAGQQQQVSEPAAGAPGSPPSLTGSSGYNRAPLSAPAMSYKLELAVLKLECKAEGISLDSLEFYDSAMDVLDRFPQMLAMQPATSGGSTRHSAARSGMAAQTVGLVDYMSMVQSPDVLRTSLALDRPLYCSTHFYCAASRLMHDWAARFGVVQVASMLQNMPPRSRARLGPKIWLAADIFGGAASLQAERLSGAGSSDAAATRITRLPAVPPEVAQAHSLQFVLTLLDCCDEASSTTQPARTRRGGAAAAAAATSAGSLGQRWLEAAAECIEAQGVKRPYGRVSLTCNWGQLWALLQQQGMDACLLLGTAWRSLVLRMLASPERIQRHGRLYMCVHDPSSPGAQCQPLPTYCTGR